ncbi:MAG: dephospho-CoA kinase [Geminocystis sp.]|nr:dephospho-CoA kinase [Geminocystis sp.]MCS7148221.1 dephospho-CoA kinase [Geminocystis sp.]MDW8116527.1 dephospho-CoA kinase [Geminocystis sp.]MDW8462295.1 dephospho-CoA kinase [Geminocystis sp.]
MKKKIVGLTGGIATGKSSVANYLNQKYGIPVFDADVFAREAVVVNSPIYRQILKRYGSGITLDNGQLNRTLLAEIIFNNPEEKKWLESQIHPFVYQRFLSLIPQLTHPLNVFVIPLLFEAKMTDLVSEIWVVACSFENQLKRLQQRDNLSEKQAISRINSQMPLEEKIKLAHIVIDNNGSPQQLFSQLDQIMSREFNKN